MHAAGDVDAGHSRHCEIDQHEIDTRLAPQQVERRTAAAEASVPPNLVGSSKAAFRIVASADLDKLGGDLPPCISPTSARLLRPPPTRRPLT
jgi:hypothetical protein